MNNRYNPGYWTGAKTPPSVKNLWSTKDRHWLGVVFIVGGVITVVSAFFLAPTPDVTMILGFMGLGEGAFGLILLFSREHPKGKRTQRKR